MGHLQSSPWLKNTTKNTSSSNWMMTGGIPRFRMMLNYMYVDIPSGYLTVRHGKIHHAIKFGKPSISIRAIYTMANC